MNVPRRFLSSEVDAGTGWKITATSAILTAQPIYRSIPDLDHIMTSFADTVAFCFPKPAYSSRSSRPNSTAGTLTDRQEPEDLDLGHTAKFSFATWFKNYAFDWLLAVTLWCVLLAPSRVSGLLTCRGVLSLLNQMGGHKREFSLTDISIQHTFAVQERVPPK